MGVYYKRDWRIRRVYTMGVYYRVYTMGAYYRAFSIGVYLWSLFLSSTDHSADLNYPFSWGANGSGAVDVGRICLGAEMTGRRCWGAIDRAQKTQDALHRHRHGIRHYRVWLLGQFYFRFFRIDSLLISLSKKL
jgi:hypothetical protein